METFEKKNRKFFEFLIYSLHKTRKGERFIERCLCPSFITFRT